MKYFLFIIVLLMMLLGCGKKGPIELPTGYHDDTIQNAEKLDPPIVPVAEGTNIQSFNPKTGYFLWMGFSNNRELRALLRYNIASLTDMDLTSTTLSIKMKIDRKSLSAPIQLRGYRLTKAWTQNLATWDNSTTDVSWVTPGGDYTTEDAFTVTVSPDDSEITLTDAMLRPFVTFWKNNADENFGFILVPDIATSTTMEFVAINSASYGVEADFPRFSYTVGDTTKYLNPSDQSHIINSNVVDNNDSGVFIIGDGYHPILNIDTSIIRQNLEWDILQASLTFHADDSALQNQLNLPAQSATEKYFTVYLGTPTADGFTIQYYFYVTHKTGTGQFTIDITQVCRYLQTNSNYTLMLYLSSEKTMARFLPVTLGELNIYYRKPVASN